MLNTKSDTSMESTTYTHLELIDHNQAACAQHVCLDTHQSPSASPTGTCPSHLPPTSTSNLQPHPYLIESSSDTSTSRSTVYSWLENILCSTSATAEPANTRQSTSSTCEPRLHSNSGDLHSEPLKSSSRKRKRTEGSSYRPRLTRKALEIMESSATLQNVSYLRHTIPHQESHSSDTRPLRRPLKSPSSILQKPSLIIIYLSISRKRLQKPRTILVISEAS